MIKLRTYFKNCKYSKMFCKNCGNEIKGNTKFCPKCGSSVNNEATKADNQIELPEEKHFKKKSILGTILAITVGLATFVFVSSFVKGFIDGISGSTADWQEYNSQNGNFLIKFPCKPELESSPLEKEGLKITYNLVQCSTSDNNAYQVAYTTYPQEVDTSDPKVNLKNAQDGSISAVKGALQSSTDIIYKNYPANDYTVKTPEGYVMKARNILVNHTLYSLGVIDKNNANQNYDKFINSFSLK